jgi:hypothetical protein
MITGDYGGEFALSHCQRGMMKCHEVSEWACEKNWMPSWLV